MKRIIFPKNEEEVEIFALNVKNTINMLNGIIDHSIDEVPDEVKSRMELGSVSQDKEE